MRDTKTDGCRNQVIANQPHGPYYVEVLWPDGDQSAARGVLWQRVGRAVVDREHRAFADDAAIGYLERYDGSRLSIEAPSYYEFPGQRPARVYDDASLARLNQCISIAQDDCCQASQGISTTTELVSIVGTARVLRTIGRPVEISAPAPSRPDVPWVEGIDRALVREHWSTTGESPFEEPRPGVRTVGPARKVVIYERTHPEIRLSLLLGEIYERNGAKWQKILESRVERDGGVDPKQSKSIEERLWNEICPVERRGRPHGTGRAKRKLYERIEVEADTYLKLERAGLSQRQIQVLSLWSQRLSQTDIAQKLHISPAAICQCLRRAQNKLQKINSKFSLRRYRLAPEQVESGQRRNGRKQTVDTSGVPYVRDIHQELEHPGKGRES
jgi:predicted DNA-binding protein YlxM (UPF0122 family)